MTDTPVPSAPPLDASRGNLRLAVSIFAPPMVWLLHLVVSYALVESSCGSNVGWLIHTSVSAVALLLALPGGMIARNEWKDAQADDRSDHASLQRRRLLAAAGMANSFFFSAIILLAWTASLVISPCAP